VLQMERPEVFYTWEWAFAMQTAYGDQLKPLLICAYEGRELVGLASLATRDCDSDVSFLAATTSDYCEILSRSDRRQGFVDAMLKELRVQGCRRISLASIPEDSPTIRVLQRAAAAQEYHLFGRPAQLCALVLLGDSNARAALKATVLAKKQRRRAIRAIEREGAFGFAHLRGWDDVKPQLQTFYVMQVARFLTTNRTSNLIRPERRRFQNELAQLLCEGGYFCLTLGTIEGRPVCWNYGFQFGASWFWYLPTFDDCLERYSPGYLMLSAIVAAACDDPKVYEVDLGVGSEEYKERFCNGTRRTFDFRLNRSHIRHASEIARYRTVRTIKNFPRVERMFRGLVARIKSVRARYRAGNLGTLLGWGIRRLRDAVWSRTEVVFLRWTRSEHSPGEQEANQDLRRMNLEMLAKAAMVYANDEETIAYLLRASQRLTQNDKVSGFVLCSEDTPVHFCWTGDFEGFYMDELKTHVSAPSHDSALIFDCWTPSEVRGRNYYGSALSGVAQSCVAEHKLPWIFSASTNAASLRGIEKAGFQQAYSLVRRKVLFSIMLGKKPFAPVEALTQTAKP
jgi:CelD/BcsL family acetyltransferase involved in cellulose biosynthesis